MEDDGENAILSRQEGYDYDFVDKLDEKYECAICLLVLRSPCQTVCGHRFCRDCIFNCITNGTKLCPVDNNPLSPNDIFSDACVEREILDLLVLCPSHKHGCNRNISLRDLGAHLRACHYQVVLCPNQCASTVLTGELQQHLLETCMLRPTRCNLCGSSYTFDKELLHRAVCGDVEISCDSCGDVVKRGNLASHLSTLCPDTVISCLYSEHGCNVKCRRELMEKHLKTDLPSHLQLLSSAYKRLNTYVTELSRTVGTIQSPSFSRQPSLRSQLSASSPVLVDQICEEDESEVAIGAAIPLDFDEKRSKLDVRKREDIAIEAAKHQMHLSSNGYSSNKLASNSQLLKEMSNKVVDQNQRLVEDEIKLDNLRKQVEDIQISFNDKLDTLSGRFCNGDFIWRIPNFSFIANDMKNKKSSMYSYPFYTSRFGYKCSLRIHINQRDGQFYLSLYIRMLQGENDDILSWPFEGTVTFAILDYSPNNPKKHIIDHLQSTPDAQAFKRPTKYAGDKSFGFTEFALLDSIVGNTKNGGEGEYLINDVLAIRVKVIAKDWFEFPSSINGLPNFQFVRNGSVDSTASRK